MIFPKKEMEYCFYNIPGKGPEILAGGDLYDTPFKYLIINHSGDHPCCYVGIPNGLAINTDDIYCHGGVSWCGDLPSLVEDAIKDNYFLEDTWWIGWDYAHYGDYMKYDLTGHKWTTHELWDECMEVVNHLIAIYRKEQIKYDQT